LLFSTAPISEVPFLDGSLEWQGDINRASGTGARPTLHLLQLDVAVKDSRANSTIGWVFGTFQYEKAASTSANWWDHMVPVGLMWGSDVTSLKADTQTKEEWINTARGQKLHLGRKDLVLNGPIDNPRGSCASCHGFAQVARVTGATPSLPAGPPADAATPAALDAYFTDIKAATPLSPDYVSLDYSLQLQIGIARAIKGGASLPPDLNAAPHAAHAHAHAMAAHAPHGSVPTEIPEVRRDSE
jgi:mono/diheme cytochrome c family protein